MPVFQSFWPDNHQQVGLMAHGGLAQRPNGAYRRCFDVKFCRQVVKICVEPISLNICVETRKLLASRIEQWAKWAALVKTTASEQCAAD